MFLLFVVADESESRRNTLMHKLKEAQTTLDLQNERLGKIESAAKENNALVEDLKFKERVNYQMHSSNIQTWLKAYNIYTACVYFVRNKILKFYDTVIEHITLSKYLFPL